jgi:hypothetical protein
MFDGLLKELENLALGRFAAYADDLVVLVKGNLRSEIEVEGQQITNKIIDWCKSAKLEISQKKDQSDRPQKRGRT